VLAQITGAKVMPSISDSVMQLSAAAQIFYLNRATQPLLRKHIDGLPALYLDCDEDIDLEHDVDAKEAVAKQIKDFSDHVRALREAR
jgi:hypothetical protein